MLEAYKNAASESDFIAYMESTAIAQINAQAGTSYTSESDIASQIVTLQSKLDDINVMLMNQASSFCRCRRDIDFLQRHSSRNLKIK